MDIDTKFAELEARIAELEAKLAGESVVEGLCCTNFSLVDSEGRERVKLAEFSDGTVGMVCLDEQGNSRVEVQTGQAHQAEVRVSNSDGKGRVGFGSNDTSSPNCWAYDSTGTLRWQVGDMVSRAVGAGQAVEGIASHGTLYLDEDAKARGSFGTTETGSMYWGLSDTSGFIRLSATVWRDGTATPPTRDLLA